MQSRSIGFIGAGLMAEALAEGILDSGVVSPDDIYASDPDEKRRQVFRERLGTEVSAANRRVVRQSDVVILAVKPQVLPEVAREISKSIEGKHLVISIAPGVKLASLEQWLGTDRLVRVMPNTPALVGEGASAFAVEKCVDKGDVDVVETILGSVGRCVKVNEELMDAVTGLSGSGPAFLFAALEAMADGGVEAGLSREQATELAAQTMRGAATLVLETDTHPAELKDAVTTPAGTTAAGLHALESDGLRAALMDAVKAAVEKGRCMGEE